MEKRRITATSQVKAPGPCRLLRPELPNVPSALERNAAVLNHWLSDGLVIFESAITSGRSAPMPVSELSLPADALNQNPVRLVTMAEVSQFPKRRFAQRPARRGLSATIDALKICRISTTQL